jgi:hypothetical protein
VRGRADGRTAGRTPGQSKDGAGLTPGQQRAGAGLTPGEPGLSADRGPRLTGGSLGDGAGVPWLPGGRPPTANLLPGGRPPTSVALPGGLTPMRRRQRGPRTGRAGICPVKFVDYLSPASAWRPGLDLSERPDLTFQVVVCPGVNKCSNGWRDGVEDLALGHRDSPAFDQIQLQIVLPDASYDVKI